jgi:Domain of unknown function DUF29
VQDRPKKSDTLYDADFFAWTQEQARLLRDRRFDDVDLGNVVEEIESVGRSEKREIRNRLTVLVMHLLKWKYQPGARTQSWQRAIRNQRTEIEAIVEDSPSLMDYAADIAGRQYRSARLAAAEETGIDFTLFPDLCPFSSAEILDPDFLPREPDIDAGN